MTAGFVPDSSPKPTPTPGGFTPDSGGFKPDGGFTPDKPKQQPAPKATPSGLYSVNAAVNVVGDYLTRWTQFGMGGIRDQFRPIVDGLSNLFHLGVYDFNKGHHYAPNDPHLDGRAMDVDTINGESVGTKLTPTISNYITQALAQNPGVRVGVPSQIYRALPADQRARAFVDAPAHIHTELSSVMPGQTVAPKGFKPDVSKGFVKDPQAAAKQAAFQAGAKPPPIASAGNPMDAPDPTVAGPNIVAHSAINMIAAHQDLPFILANAQLRDADPKTGQAPSILEGMRNPNSHVAQAWRLYQSDPAAAMDEYGMGSPAQNRFMATKYPQSTEGKFSATMLKVPLLNFLNTFFTEQVNPMAMAEGGLASKGLGMAGAFGRGTAAGARVSDAAMNFGERMGVGSPLRVLRAHDLPGNPEASQWGAGIIASLNAPHTTPKINLPSGREMTEQIFDNFDQATKDEIVRLKQGLKPNPAFEAQHADLAQRAQLLDSDMATVQGHKERVGLLTPENTFDWANRGKKFFPMKGTYTFDELEESLRPPAKPGGTTTAHKTVADLDHALATGNVDPEHDMAVNYATWRRQSLEKVAFEDGIARAPESLRRDVFYQDFKNTLGIPGTQPQQPHFGGIGLEKLGKGFEQPDPWTEMKNAFDDFNSRLVGDEHNIKTQQLADELGWKPNFGDPRRVSLESNPRWVAAKNLMPDPKRSPALEKSMIAPQLWEFLRGQTIESPGQPAKDLGTSLRSYIDNTGSQLPGREQTFLGRYVAMMRNMIMTNFVVHPAKNVAGNDALARGIYNLGGPQWNVGGYAYQAAMAMAVQAGLRKPESFVGGAKNYAHWADRALVAGGLAEFGEPRTAALGGDYTAVMTSPSKKWIDRVNRALTRAGDINRDRTFGAKGEQWMAVSFFKDAVEKGGMSDAEAARVTRKFMGDYYNFDPKSPWSSFFYFLPFLKGNMSSWIQALVTHPQYITGPQHAFRNVNLQNYPDTLGGAYPPPDWRIGSYTVPFVGHNISNIAQAVANIPQGPEAVWQPLQDILTARGTPLTTAGVDILATGFAQFNKKDVQGPESGDWNLIVNPKAPPAEKYKQLIGYGATHFLPIPLVSYAAQDAVRKGMSWGDLGRAFVSASGAGFIGQEKMDDYTKRMLGKYQKDYLKAYNHYRYDDFGVQSLYDAWDTYTGHLRDLGVIQ